MPRYTGVKRGRPSYVRKRPKSKRVRTAGAIVTQSRVFIPRSFGNPMAYGETKYFDTEREVTNIASIGGASWANTELDPTTINCLFAPTQGTGFNNREGRKVWIKKIKIRGIYKWGAVANAVAGPVGDNIRIIVYMDKQTNATQAQGEDVIQSGTASAEPTICEFQNPAAFGRFRVMYDRTFSAPSMGMTYDGTNIEIGGSAGKWKFMKKFRRPLLVHFNATNGGTVADIVDNSFHVLAADAAGTRANTVAYKCRIAYCE